MAPLIHFIRHAQGYHNLGIEFSHLPDPVLTPKGKEQCEQLRQQHFPDHSQPGRLLLIAASPLKRTLHTAWLTFQPALASSNSNGTSTTTNTTNTTSSTTPAVNAILAVPDVQETSDFPCDTGTDVPELRDFVQEQGWPVDLSLLPDGWNVKKAKKKTPSSSTTSTVNGTVNGTVNSSTESDTEGGDAGRYAPTHQALAARAKAARQLLRRKARELVLAGHPNAEIALVTHGGFLHYLTDDWENAFTYTGTGWANCETRSYTFAHLDRSEESSNTDDGNGNSDDEARLVETIESRRKRGLSHPMPDPEAQKSLRLQAMQGWEAQGLQRPDKL